MSLLSLFPLLAWAGLALTRLSIDDAFLKYCGPKYNFNFVLTFLCPWDVYEVLPFCLFLFRLVPVIRYEVHDFPKTTLFSLIIWCSWRSTCLHVAKLSVASCDLSWTGKSMWRFDSLVSHDSAGCWKWLISMKLKCPGCWMNSGNTNLYSLGLNYDCTMGNYIIWLRTWIMYMFITCSCGIKFITCCIQRLNA